ncbi:hypothetical protein [Tenacibaculum sp. 190524A05c]|uniref:hypothetical protein n=1 Tax=Tenacibaculum platacis TaxID=3137852 RepID=UPI0032B154AE
MRSDGNILIVLLVFLISIQLKAQEINGGLLLNNNKEIMLSLESKSAVDLFKQFKVNTYKIGFNFKADGLKKNEEGEFVVFFDFMTVVKKDGRTIRKVRRHIPMPYFPGEMFLPAEAFDFIGVLSVTSWDDMEKRTFVPQQKSGILKSGKYEVQLSAIPRDVKGKIDPVTFGFVVK